MFELFYVRTRKLWVVGMLLLSWVHFAQVLPPINTYTSLQHGGGNQNWSISQASNKFIYVANNKGLLEFNGANWKLYLTPNNTIMRSVKVIGEKIYSGAYMDFGYWSRENTQQLRYTSLVEQLKIELKDDEQFWGILELDGYILFQSLHRIYLYNPISKKVNRIDSEAEITKMFLVDNSIYFHKKNLGVFKIENGQAVPFTQLRPFAESDVIGMYKENNQFIVLTENQGIHFLNDNKLTAWEGPNTLLKGKTVYSSAKLADGRLVVGTISNGAIVLDRFGNLDLNISQREGLNNNTVLSVFEDADANIWFGLDSGINSVNGASNVRVYRNNKGFIGTVYTSIVHNGYLYLGSNQGLFAKKLGENTDFISIENTKGQVWNLRLIDGQLFCSHDSGLFVIDNTKVAYQINRQGTWDVRQLDATTILTGNYFGLGILKKKGTQWVFRNKLQGFNNSSKHLEFSGNRIVVNHEYKGVFKLEMDKGYNNILTVAKDTSVTKGLHSSLVKFNRKILYASKNGIYQYDDKSDSFVKDNLLSSIYSEDEFTSGKLVYDEVKQRLWGFSSKHLFYISPGKLSNVPIINKIAISNSLREGALGYENIYALNPNEHLIGTNNGYIIVNAEEHTKPGPIQTYINQVSTKELDSRKSYVPVNTDGMFAYESNSVAFEFSTPQYNSSLETEYQYKLEGLNDTWSPWSGKSNASYVNLKYGKYTFQVRSKAGNELSTNVASYTFSIKKPWYLSNAMVAVYLIFLVLVFYVIHIVNKRYYKSKGKKLLAEQQREFELQELEKEKELVVLKNEQLRNDVESKNRELASSTMSMIKKNEFLNTIKNELKKVEGTSVHRVVKIIDKNLNNKDDWRLFEEAFNNADKGFIKKVKSMHPELTPNDLRLCAYLRLNLPSKEIAPLLNISPRSVEVKRYRLRKKMNLNHKEKLTDYILNL